MLAQARRLSWQLLLVIALAVALVTAVVVAHYVMQLVTAPHHYVAGVGDGVAGSGPSVSPDTLGDGGTGH